MLNIIRNLLKKILNDIDTGNSNINEEEEHKIVDLLKEYTANRLSKYQAYNYLNMSRSKFDKLVKDGDLPKGIKQQGFKELSWNKAALDKFVANHK